MSPGRTSWWPCDAAEHARELTVELGQEFGAAGPLMLRVLKDLAQQQRDEGQVRTGFRSLARDLYDVDAAKTREILEYAASIGAIDDLNIDEDGRRFTCRVSGWVADQARGRAAIKKAGQREDGKGTDESPVPSEGDKSPNTGTVSPVVPPTRDEITKTERDSPAVPKAVVARESAGDARNGEDSLSRVVDDVVGILQRGIDSIPGDQPMKRPTALAIRTALTNHPVHPDAAVAVAMEARAIAQSQDRAPNIAALFEQKLAARSIGRAA
jgi:hypothetical protein